MTDIELGSDQGPALTTCQAAVGNRLNEAVRHQKQVIQLQNVGSKTDSVLFLASMFKPEENASAWLIWWHEFVFVADLWHTMQTRHTCPVLSG